MVGTRCCFIDMTWSNGWWRAGSDLEAWNNNPQLFSNYAVGHLGEPEAALRLIHVIERMVFLGQA